MQQSGAVPGQPADIRQRSGFILSGLTASHALFHAFRQSLLVLLPNVRDAMGLTDVQATAIGFVSFSRLALSAPSPVIAGWLYRPEAPQPVFYYIATIFAISACVLLFIPLRRPVPDSACIPQ